MNVYGYVPPLTVRSIVPLFAPLQETFVGTSEMESGAGCIIEKLLNVEQFLKSVTVTV
ncbi:hypothetical protein D3C80_985510 [compost metagenome]